MGCDYGMTYSNDICIFDSVYFTTFDAAITLMYIIMMLRYSMVTS